MNEKYTLAVRTFNNVYFIDDINISSNHEDHEKFLSKLFSKIISDGYFIFTLENKRTICLNKENIVAMSIEKQFSGE